MIVSSLLSLTLSLSLAVSLPPASARAEHEATRTDSATDAKAEPTSIVVTVSSNLGSEDGGEDGGAVESVVRETVVRRLQSHGLAVGERGTTRIVVQIEWVDEARDGYALRYDVVTPWQPQTERTSRCARCGSDELVALIEQDVDGLRPELEAKPAPPPKPAIFVHTPPPTKPSRRLGAMGIAGVATLAAGFVATVPGIVLAAIGDSSGVGPEDSELLEVTARRTPGLVLVGVGTAAMIVGAVLLGVDQRRRRQRSTRTPHVAVTSLGLGMRW